jgi:hypothetical protein
MMSHLDEGLLQELLDGEIPSTDLPPIQAHLNACAECRARLEEARAFAGEAEQLIERIELTDAVPSRAITRPTAPRPAWGRNLAWAATLVIAVGTGYLARGSTPVSPLREEMAKAPDTSVPGIVTPLADSRAAAPPAPAEPALRAKPNESRRPATPPPATSGQVAPAPSVAKALASAEGRRDSGSAIADSLRKKERRLGDTPMRLDEIVTTSVPESRALRALPLTAPSADASRRAEAEGKVRANEQAIGGAAGRASGFASSELTLPEAMRRMGGTIRLIDGLVPLRLEGRADEVRVIYPTSRGELVLAQRLVDGRVTFELIGPPGFPSDSLRVLRDRVRE